MPYKQVYKMFCVLIICVALTVQHVCYLPEERLLSPQEYAMEAMDLMDDAILATPNLFREVRESVRERTRDAPSYAHTYTALAWAMKTLGGKHSSFLDPASIAANHAGLTNGEEPSEKELPTVTNDRGITTITLPRTVAAAVAKNRYMNRVISELATYKWTTPCGYIVDLREDQGGNYYAMIGGLTQLLIDGPVISFKGINTTQTVTLNKGRLIYEGQVQPSAGSSLTPNRLPIAILTSFLTASAAEAVVVSFTGQDNTRTFGEPTNGLTTGNTVRFLPDGAALVVTVGTYVDRNGTEYDGPIKPDVPTTYQNAEETARDWIHAQCEVQ